VRNQGVLGLYRPKALTLEPKECARQKILNFFKWALDACTNAFSPSCESTSNTFAPILRSKWEKNRHRAAMSFCRADA